MAASPDDHALAISAADTDLLLKHYAVAGPLVERVFVGIPFVWTTLPKGPNGPQTYHGPLSVHTRPKAPVVDVPMDRGVQRYCKLSAERISGLVRHGAVEVHSWSPTAADPMRAQFARLLIETEPGSPRSLLFDAIEIVSKILKSDEGVDGPLTFDGGTGAAKWIPFADSPTYEDVRAWLRRLCESAVERHGDVVTLEPNTHHSARAHLHLQSNSVGRFSALPYSVRGSAGYPIALPADPHDRASWEGASGVLAGGLEAWLATHGGVDGEPFRRFVEPFAAQRFAGRVKPAAVFAAGSVDVMPAQASHGPIVNAAIAVLMDGQSHSAEDILKIALERHLLDQSVSHKYVYTSLIEYIARANGNGRKPQIVQNGDRTFRINETPDYFPAVPDEPAAPLSAERAALCDRLVASAQGPPEAFEQAVCDAFEALGFSATHLGGQKAPDGYIDAPLGRLSYRSMIECKSGDEGVNDPSVFEAAKYRDQFGAQHCALVARAFSSEISLPKELDTHGVSAWTVDDLVMLLHEGANPFELEAAFAPGFAKDAVDTLLWERRHGQPKRVRFIADAILRTGWTTQRAYEGAAADAPSITEDVAMVLVNQDLAAEGSSATCSREDVRAAFDYLAGPLVRCIVRNTSDGSIVVVNPVMPG